MWEKIAVLSEDDHVFNDTFSVSTLVRIESQDPTLINDHPKLRATYRNEHIAVAIDKTLHLMDKDVINGRGQNTLFPLDFGCDINCLTISSDGSLIVCGLSDGNIYGLLLEHLKNGPVFSISIANENENPPAFVDVIEWDSKFYFCCTNGMIYSIANIEMSKVKIEPDSDNVDVTVSNNISLCVENSKRTNLKISAYTMALVEGEPMHIYAGEDHIFMKSASTEYRIKLDGVKKLQSDGILTFALTEKGELFELCPYSGMAICVDTPESIHDFIITATNDDDIEILMQAEESTGSRSLKVFDYLNINCKCSMPVSNEVWLIDQPKSSASIFYFGGTRSSSAQYIENILLHMVSESQPEKHLHTLLTKGMLVEAEELAKKFSLNPQPIYEAKAKKILQEMGTINQNDVNVLKTRLDDLIAVAQQITNIDFLLQLRNLEMPDRKVMKKVLEFLTEKIKFDKHPKIGEEIKEQLLRLNTLQLIDPSDTMLTWQKFVQHPNLGNYLMKYIESDMPAACLVMKQHASSIVPLLKEKVAVKMLKEIPLETEPFQIIQWMRHYFPLVSEELPETLPKIIDWIITKTKSYERSNDWPAIGIEFGKNMLEICNSVKYTFADQRRSCEKSITQLRRIIEELEELLVLKTQYNLHVHFEEYSQSSVEECAFNLLQRINIKNMPNLVNNFLFVIFTEKGKQLQLQNTLTRYIEHLMQYRSALQTWLPRAVVCLQLITNQDEKFRCALAIAKAAPIPWPQEMNPIIELRTSSHRLAIEIDNEHKMQQVKRLRLKYGYSADSKDDPTKFANRMISQNREELLEDLQIFKKFSPEISPETNFYCVYYLSRDGYSDKAQAYLKTLTIEEVRSCYTKVAKIVPLMISDYVDKPQIYDNLMDLLKFVLDKDIDDDNKEKIKHLMNLHLLKKSALNMSITIDCVSDRGKVQGYLDSGIDKLLDILKTREKYLADIIWKNVKILSDALKLSKFDIIFKLMNKINNVQFTTLLAKIFRDDTGSNENYIRMAVTLIRMQYQTSSEAMCADDCESYAYPIALLYLQMVKGMDIVDLQQLIHFAKIGSNEFECNVFEKYLTIRDALDSLSNLETTASSRRRDSMSIFEEVNHANPTPVITHRSAAVINTLSLVLQAIIGDLKPKTPFYDFLKDEIKISEPANKSKLIGSIEQLIKMKVYTTTFSIIHCIRTQQKHTDYKILAGSLEKILIRKILKSALHQKEPQFHLLVPVLRSDPDPQEALRAIRDELKSSLSKMNCLLLTEKYSELIGNASEAKAAKEAHLKYKYYMQLRQLDPSLKDDFEISFPQLLNTLNNKTLDIHLLERMCKDFEWNFQKVLIAQISTILSIQELEFETQTDELGVETIDVHSSSDKLRALCEPYLSQVTDLKSLSSRLYEVLNIINPYFYELYLCVLNILNEIGELRPHFMQWTHILIFLKHKMVKKRERRIGQFEVDWWIKKHTESTLMPRISKYRLPFLMVVTEPHQEFLGDVVTIEDCVEWFPLIKFLSYATGKQNPNEIDHEKDTLCMTVFKKVLSERQSASKEHNSWCLQPVNNAFLQSVLHVTQNMKDVHRILLVLYTVYCNAIEGADQLEAAKQCHKFVKKNEAALNEVQRSKDLCTQIRGKFALLKVQHQLHLYGLYDDDLSALISNPEMLIKALYDRINIDLKCDINKVAEEFCKLYQKSFHELQIDLLNIDTLNQTVYEDELNATIAPTNNEDEDAKVSVEKAYYILKSWDPVEASQFVLSSLCAASESANTGRRLQLLDCLMKLSNQDTAETFLDFVDKSKYIALKCVHHLKSFGYTLSPEKFESYDKIKILKQIWTAHATNAKALNVMTYICMGYDMYEPKIWDSVLRQMVTLHMTNELSAIIDKISMRSEIIHSDGIVAAFNYLIRLPFKNMHKTRSDEQDEEMSKALFMLQSCPVKHKFNFSDLVETCIALKQYHFGAILLALSADELKPQIQKMLMPHRHEGLTGEINNLEEYGIYSFITKQAVKLLSL